MLQAKFSPEQIAGHLRNMNTIKDKDRYVCRETIYNAIYALPVGELRKELAQMRLTCSASSLSAKHNARSRIQVLRVAVGF